MSKLTDVVFYMLEDRQGLMAERVIRLFMNDVAYQKLVCTL
jgi:hypothetical protein